MSRLAPVVALPLVIASCGVKEVDDLIDEQDDPDQDTDTLSGDCPEQDLGSAVGAALAQGQTNRQSTPYRVCGGSGSDTGGWGTGGDWGSSGGSTGGWSEGSSTGAPPPDGPDDGGFPGVSFRWTAPSSGSYIVDSCGSRFDTMLGVRGQDCEGDTLECNDDWYGLRSRVSVDADAGDTYVFVLTGYGGEVGGYTLSIGEGEAAGPCVGDTGWGTTTTTWYGTDTGWTSEIPEVGVEWTPSGVDLSIYGGPGGYWFGMAETADCVDCWTGEDCVYGDDFDGSTVLYCHDVGDGGGVLTYGGDRGALVEGTTGFSDPSDGEGVTYLLGSDPAYGGDGSCFVWGHDPSYYEGLGCFVL